MTPAVAAPGDEAAAARSDRDAAAAEVRRLEQLVAESEDELSRFTVEAEAAADTSRQAQEELAAAQAAASAAEAELQTATAAVDQARAGVARLGRETYMRSDALETAAALLDSAGPAEFLQRASTLEMLTDDRAAELTEFRALEREKAEAGRAAQTALSERDQAAAGAAELEAAAQARLVEAKDAYDSVTSERAALQGRLQQAEIALLELEGAADGRAAWADRINTENAQRDAQAAATAAAAASGRAVAPTTGRVTSCYGSRWGTMHYGVDIAAPIGTPIYAPEAGRVLQAGPASGFGLAVYVQHPDGSITVYGHINDYFVQAGQQVSIGQQIAEVGNTGQSTGPHLHFEVRTGGLNANRGNPIPWLAARGVSLGGGC
ncbi:M23 family peptidase [Blastococcus sp. MG754426]|nr:M23 family peptidase [Blastococcus sp. MG754426]MCF6513491.1 M23 family peptidase [Blastococcus sp. MG754427]MCF6736132.1 M23 family peptidase [Blastococcus sp. KM273129]RBY92500.1 M23 family peptidase [Blastococcus sp. TF02-8]